MALFLFMSTRSGGGLHTWRRRMVGKPDRFSDSGVQYEKHKRSSDL